MEEIGAQFVHFVFVNIKAIEWNTNIIVGISLLSLKVLIEKHML